MAVLKTMKVKDSEGNEITVGMLDAAGNPIYEIDGKEVGQDLALLRDDLKKANAESADRRHKLQEANEKLALFGDLDPEKAKAAMTTVAALDDKKLVDAKQVEVLQQKWEETFKINKQQSDASYEAKIKELTELAAGKEESIKRMLVKGVFDTSQFLDKTIYGPLRDSAYKMFGEHFEVAQNENGEYTVTAKLNGVPIISVARPGQPATSDEALEEIIKAHPQREHIMKGSQASGGGTVQSGGGGSKTTAQQLQERYDAAVKTNNFQEQVRLKRELHEAKQAAA